MSDKKQFSSLVERKSALNKSNSLLGCRKGAGFQTWWIVSYKIVLLNLPRIVQKIQVIEKSDIRFFEDVTNSKINYTGIDRQYDNQITIAMSGVFYRRNRELWIDVSDKSYHQISIFLKIISFGFFFNVVNAVNIDKTVLTIAITWYI